MWSHPEIVRKLLHIACVLLLAVSCGPRVIDRGDMEEIMYQMLIQDQQIKRDFSLKTRADTCLVYESIFEEFGYDTDDYLYSLDYYLEDPSRFEKVMEKVAERLEKEASVAKGELDLENWRNRLLSIYRMPVDTTLPRPRPRFVDSLPLRFRGDSVYAVMPDDSLPVYPKDSLLFVRDTVEVVKDTLAVRDSL